MSQRGTAREMIGVCECGDYQDQHEGGRGRCSFGERHIPRGPCAKYVEVRRIERCMTCKCEDCQCPRVG
jgi:hypothetical protein